MTAPLELDALVADLRRLGVAPGQTLLVHSSFKSLGPVAGGPATVIDALCAAVGPDGTVAFPNLPFKGSHLAYLQSRPVFDVRHTPALTGIISELARHRPGARRSLHPSHPVAALGPQAEFLVRDHELSLTPCRRDQSPYGRLLDLPARILLLGVGNRCNTTVHACEEFARVPYLFTPETYPATVIDDSGRERVVHSHAHDYRGLRLNFTRLDAELPALGIARPGQVGAAAALLIDVRRLADWLVPLLEREPRYLVTPAA